MKIFVQLANIEAFHSSRMFTQRRDASSFLDFRSSTSSSFHHPIISPSSPPPPPPHKSPPRIYTIYHPTIRQKYFSSTLPSPLLLQEKHFLLHYSSTQQTNNQHSYIDIYDDRVFDVDDDDDENIPTGSYFNMDRGRWVRGRTRVL